MISLRFFGTGALDSFRIKNRLSKEYRRFSTLLIDEKIIIDPSEDIFEFVESFMLQGILDDVRDVFITHSHIDHFSISALERLASDKRIRVFASSAMKDEIATIKNVDYTEIYPFAEFEYGILPCPIYEEGQDYTSVIYFNNWAHLWTLPNMLENTEYAERMLEIMAVYSSLSGSTMDAYYERTIYLNAARDNGSREVLDVIRESLVYDIALMYDWGGLETMLWELSYATSNPYASAVNGIEDSVNPKIEDTIEQLRNPAGDS